MDCDGRNAVEEWRQCCRWVDHAWERGEQWGEHESNSRSGWRIPNQVSLSLAGHLHKRSHDRTYNLCARPLSSLGETLDSLLSEHSLCSGL